MTGVVSAVGPDDAPDKPRKQNFRRRFNVVPPDPGLVDRQMQVAKLAFKMFGDAEAARLFLNEMHGGLGGRPIDIAGRSAAGLDRVVGAIGVRTTADADGDSCFAIRLANAFTRRFGVSALDRAALRLSRARERRDVVKTDLFVAVNVVLRNDQGIYSRSRAG